MQAYSCGLDVLIDLISNVTERQTAQQICQALMDDFGSFERILYAHPDQLRSSIQGTKEFSNKIVFVLECAKALTKRRYTESFCVGKRYEENAIVKYLIGLFLFEDAESVFMLSFDQSGNYLSTDSISTGTVNNSNITVRRALELAIRHDAHYVIFAHNHPLGASKPSGEDLSMTHLLSRSFATVNIELREHYVISGNSFSKINSEIAGALRCEAVFLSP